DPATHGATANPVRPSTNVADAPQGGSAFGVPGGTPGIEDAERDTGAHVTPPSLVLQTSTGSLPAAAEIVATAHPCSGSTNCRLPSNDGRDVKEEWDQDRPPSFVRNTVTDAMSATPSKRGQATQAWTVSRKK